MEASLLLGSVSYLRGDLSQAADHYRKAHSASPHAQQPLLNLANTLGDLYRQMEARMSNQVVEILRCQMHGHTHPTLFLMSLNHTPVFQSPGHSFTTLGLTHGRSDDMQQTHSLILVAFLVQNEAMRGEMKAIHGESIAAYETLLRNNPGLHSSLHLLLIFSPMYHLEPRP